MGTRTAQKTDVAVQEAAGAVGAALDYGDDFGGGFKGQTSDDQMIPFIEVLQGLSPKCLEEDSDARPGMLRDTATDEIYSGKTGILFVPACTQHVVCEWRPRDAGGGLVGRHEPHGQAHRAAEALSRNANGKVVNAEGNEMQETFYVYGIVCDDEATPIGAAVIGCASTKIKPYRGWMTRLNKFMVQTPNGGKAKPPLFAHLTRVTTIGEKRAKGDSYNLVFSAATENDLMKSLLPRNHPAFIAAKELCASVEAGKATADKGGDTKNEDTPF